MPFTISLATAMDEFDDMVQSELQNYERLAGSCRTYDTMGQNYNIPYFDQISLNERGFGSGDIPAEDISQRNVPIPPRNFEKKTTIGFAYETLFNYDVLMGHVKQHAEAIGRFNDRMKLEAVEAGDYGNSGTPGTADWRNNEATAYTAISLPTDGSAITTLGFRIANLVEMRTRAIDNGCRDDELTLYMSAQHIQSFQNDSDFKSWDQNADRPLMRGSIGMFVGVDIRTLGRASPETTLPTDSSGNQTNYLVERESVAVTYNRRPSTEIHAERWNDRNTILSTATAGSSVTRPNGVIRCRPA